MCVRARETQSVALHTNSFEKTRTALVVRYVDLDRTTTMEVGGPVGTFFFSRAMPET